MVHGMSPLALENYQLLRRRETACMVQYTMINVVGRDPTLSLLRPCLEAGAHIAFMGLESGF